LNTAVEQPRHSVIQMVGASTEDAGRHADEPIAA
jgi:hypothetical protein